MRPKQGLFLCSLTVVVYGLFVVSPLELNSQQSKNAIVRIDADDIGGVVTGANGPEAGVWVIAETTDLSTKYAKIVVTDDQGGYVIPDLPESQLHCVGARLWADRFAKS